MNEIRDHEPASCARVRGRLIELVDQDLDPLTAARDEGHLEACLPCRAERDELARVFQLARALDRPAPRELELARAALAERWAPPATRRPHPLAQRLLQAGAAAAAAVLALAALELGARHARTWRAPSRALAAPPVLELSDPARWADALQNLWVHGG